MNRLTSLAVLALMLGGCAADFGEDREPDTTLAPESSDQTNGDPTVKVYGGELQRPADTLGPVNEAVETAHSRAFRNYLERVDQAEIDLGTRVVRPINQ